MLQLLPTAVEGNITQGTIPGFPVISSWSTRVCIYRVRFCYEPKCDSCEWTWRNRFFRLLVRFSRRYVTLCVSISLVICVVHWFCGLNCFVNINCYRYDCWKSSSIVAWISIFLDLLILCVRVVFYVSHKPNIQSTGVLRRSFVVRPFLWHAEPQNSAAARLRENTACWMI